ncbi:hypothetical protein JCM5350_006298 [Sporobolomyces pararoseus]
MAYGSLPTRWNRSVSNPSRRQPVEGEFGTLPPLDRRTSLDSVVPPLPIQNPTTKRHHGLPSIKALREKFQRFAQHSGGKESVQVGNQVKKDGSVKSSDSPRKLIRRVGSGRAIGGGDGKLSQGNVNSVDGGGQGFVKSASMPAISSIGQYNDRPRHPPLPLGSVQPSIDELLADSSSKPQSSPPLSPSSTTTTTRRPARTSSISIGVRRPQTSENLSPTSQPLPVFARISSDFARPLAAPPLSALRAKQLKETESLNKTIAASNRHSRILPGATLPALFPSVDSERPPSSISRSQSARASIGSDKVQQRSSLRSQDSVRAPSIDSSSRKRFSNGGDRLKDDLAYRRHSLSPVIPSAANSSPDGSPNRPKEEETTETQRGKTLSGVLGVAARRTSTGLGFGLPSSLTGNGLEKRRPSKPFPGGFEEVPFQPTATVESPLSTSATPTSPSPSNPPRRILKAISIAPRKPTDSPALTKTPSPTEETTSFPSSSSASKSTSQPSAELATPFPQLGPVRRRQNSGGIEQLPPLPAPSPPLVSTVSTEGGGIRKSRSLAELQDSEEVVTKVEESSVKAGGYAARLAELRLLRTPNLDGEGEKKVDSLEKVEPEMNTSTSKGQMERPEATPRRTTEEEEEVDDSRPVSPSHSTTNSPGADHPFRLSTYLDFLPLTQPSPLANASPSNPNSTAPLALSSSSTGVQSAATTTKNDATKPDTNLTLAQMEQEIVKMEKELALAGTPRSFFTEEGDYDSVSLSPEVPRSFGPAALVTQSELETPSINENVVTPRTARKWSIVEVERAYERMKRLLGSSSSSRMYSPSDGGGDSQVDGNGKVEEVENGEDVFSPTRSRMPHSPLSEQPSSSLFIRRTSSSPTAELKLKPLPVLPPPSPSSSQSRAETPSAANQEVDKENVDLTRQNVSSPTESSGPRRLVLPSRVRSKSSIDDFQPNRNEGTTSPRPRSIEPISPSRASGRRSRLEDTGLLRSGAGKEIQRRALGELSLDSESPISPNRSSSRTNVHRLLPPSDSPRRRESTKVSESSTWYPATPRRNFGRSRSTTADSLTSEQDRSHLASDYDSESTSTSTARPELAEIKNLDKLQIFFKYTAVKAELAKTEIERDALADALRETRETLAEVRKQRDMYETDLKQERAWSKEVKQHLGGDQEIYVDRLENLVASRAAWQSRAEEALEELRKSKLEVIKLEQEKEAIMSSTTSKANSPSTVVPPTSTSPPGSPTLTMDPGAPHSKHPHLPSRSPLPASSNFRQKRTISTHSTASSTMGFAGITAFEIGSPLLSQTLHFGSKSSDGTYSTPTNPLNSSRVPFPSTRRVSTATGVASEEEEIDRSFDSTTSYDAGEDEKGLTERDRALLENFTNEIPKETLEVHHRNLSHLLS